MIDVKFTIGMVIRLLREQRGLNQKDFIKPHDVSMNRIEKGRIRNPERETLELIAGRLGVTVDEMFEYVEKLNNLQAAGAQKEITKEQQIFNEINPDIKTLARDVLQVFAKYDKPKKSG